MISLQLIFAMEQPQQLDYNIYKEYQIIQKIGKGTYGIVFKARHKKSNRIIAIKKIIDAFQNVIDAKRTYRQINYLLQIDHPCIVKLECLLNLNKKKLLKESSTTRLVSSPFINKDQKGFTTDKMFQKQLNQQRHVYAVFQYMPTDLYQVLKCNQLQSIQRKFIAYQLLHGVAFLHRSGLVHRDLKPMNILVNCNNLQIKICDFGMARLKQSENDVNNKEGVLTEYVASRWYRPPEILLGLASCQDTIDLWSLGCILAELILKTPLFPGKSTLDQLQLIFRCIGVPNQEQIQKLPSFGSQYVIRNFTFSKKSKFKSLQQTLSYCDNQQIDLLMNLLRFDPSKRISAAQALNHPYFEQIRQMQMNNHLKNYQKYTAKIIDLAIEQNNPQSEQRSTNKGSDVNHYRKLIQQLQKYAQRSTNRSSDVLRHINEKLQKNILLQHNLCKKNQNQEYHQGFLQKSTKDSDLANIISKKTVIQPSIKSQAISLHKNISMNNQQIKSTNKPKSKKKINSKTQSLLKTINSEIKEAFFPLKYRKNNSQKQLKKNYQSLHHQSNSKYMIVKKPSLHLIKNKEQKESKIKKIACNSEIIKKFYKKEKIENKNQIANHNSNSFHKQSISKDKSKGKSHKDQHLKNLDNIKKFAKPSLKLDKTIISKGKSSKIIKKYFTNDKV